MEFTPQGAAEVLNLHRELENFLRSKKKVFTIGEQFKHMNGMKVMSEITIPVTYSANLGCYRKHHAISTINYKDEENLSDWIVVKPLRDILYIPMDVKDFLELPDWTDDMQPSIVNTLIVK